jgi:hypothetical protein
LDPEGVPYYTQQYDTIHIDEKWFYVDKKTRRVYLTLNEAAPTRATKNINFLEKVMFLAAVARPWRCQPGVPEIPGIWYFDGKVGMYEMVNYGRAKKGNRRTGRVRGQVTIEPLTINSDAFERFMMTLLEDIAFICPREMLLHPDGRTLKKVFIQLDNATPHKVNPFNFRTKCTQVGIDCCLTYQPSQSPDMNICDLSFFPSIQSLYFKTVGLKTIKDIIAAVKRSWNEYDCNRINKAFLSLFMNYNMVLQCEGDNKYKVPHMQKDLLERAGLLPTKIAVIEPIPDNAFLDYMDEEAEVLLDIDNRFDLFHDFELDIDLD